MLGHTGEATRFSNANLPGFGISEAEGMICFIFGAAPAGLVGSALFNFFMSGMCRCTVHPRLV